MRADRKLVFDGYWGAWKKFEGTAGSLLATQVMGDHFTAQSRKFATALQAAQFPDAMPDAVYRTLICGGQRRAADAAPLSAAAQAAARH